MGKTEEPLRIPNGVESPGNVVGSGRPEDNAMKFSPGDHPTVNRSCTPRLQDLLHPFFEELEHVLIPDDDAIAVH